MAHRVLIEESRKARDRCRADLAVSGGQLYVGTVDGQVIAYGLP